jgi:hypothetical protein
VAQKHKQTTTGTITCTSRARSGRRVVTTGFLALAFGAFACDDGGINPEAATFAQHINLGQGPTQSVVGQYRQFRATGVDSLGRPAGGTATWSSSNPDVAIVSETGLVQAIAPGTANIEARVLGAKASSPITVVPWELPAASTDPVASVTIVPAELTLPVQGVWRAAAVVRDAKERLLTTRPVTWTIAEDSIASINTVGLVTGIANGSATLKATAEGVTATVPLNVAASASVVSSWPNLPADYTPIADEPFSTLKPFWKFLWNDASDGAFVGDAASPASPGSVLQIRYPSGFPGGSAPATLNFAMGGVSRAFVGVWWKASTGWQGHSSNVNKIMFLFPPTGFGDMYLAAFGPTGGPYELRAVVQFNGFELRDKLVPNADSGRVSIGEWHRIEWLVEYNSPGKADGVVRWWLDGKLVGNYTDVRFPPAPLENLKISPTWGGLGDAKTKTDFFWYDHAFVARK